jgi:hypothetical protein
MKERRERMSTRTPRGAMYVPRRSREASRAVQIRLTYCRQVRQIWFSHWHHDYCSHCNSIDTEEEGKTDDVLRSRLPLRADGSSTTCTHY